jgi:hypothetical protein
MSEEINQAPAAPAPAPISFDELKAKLVANFEMMYAQFCAQLGTIPCAQDNNYPAMRHFDDGFYNFREGIRRLTLESMQQRASQLTPAPEKTDPELPPAA